MFFFPAQSTCIAMFKYLSFYKMELNVFLANVNIVAVSNEMTFVKRNLWKSLNGEVNGQLLPSDEN